MFQRKNLIFMAASTIMALVTMPQANAQTLDRPHPRLQCAAENNITLPAKGSGEKLSADQKAVMKTCMKAARQVAFAKCAQDAGFTPVEGQKPSKEERQAVHQCMASQGFRHHRHHKTPQA